jgi:chromosomal replication initiator protein
MLGETVRPSELWEMVLSAARLHADDDTYGNLILASRLGVWEAKDEMVVVQVPSSLNQVAFNRRAVPALRKAFANVLGTEPTLMVEEVHEDFPPSQVRTNHAVSPTTNSEPDAANRSTVGRLMAGDTVLSPKYRFENFIEGPSNRMPLNAARAVAETPGKAYNPLFIHGSVGLGKTHLLQAICHRVLETNPRARVRYLSCEQFVNQFVEAIGIGKGGDFRRRFRDVDLLVIDDIHFLANKDATQEEFFHTFNELYNQGRQIVLSSDAPPREIPQMEERLTSRFLSGLTVRVEPPCTETRQAIVAAKARALGMTFSRDVIEYVADAVVTNIRELEGAVNQVVANANSLGMPVSKAVVRDALRDAMAMRSVRRASPDDIVAVVCQHYGVKPSDLQSARRTRSVTMPRQIAMFLVKRHTQKTLSEIGGYFGNRDHTTVLHSVRKIETELVEDGELRQLIGKIERELMLAG